MADEVLTSEKPAAPRWQVLAFAKPIAIVAIIVLVECVAAAMLLPTLSDTQKLGAEIAAARVGEEAGEGPTADPPHEAVSGQDVREVSLGSYHVAVFQPKSSTTLRIDLDLYGTVLADDVSTFEHIYPLHEHRLSEQVHSTFRAAEITDLTDAGLGLIKRQILEKSNRTLGKPLLVDVVFSKFSFIEQ
jgi:flagellar FliL protein